MQDKTLKRRLFAKILIGCGCATLLILGLVMTFLFFPSLQPFIVSSSFYDGMFPAGEYRLHIVDTTQKPIEGARLSVFKSGTDDPAFEYPIDNYNSSGDLVSDASGWIIAVHRERGFEFGGLCWHFLLIPVLCDEIPHFDFLLTADGYRTVRFTDDDFFPSDPLQEAVGKTTIVLDDGQEQEVRVYVLQYEMKK